MSKNKHSVGFFSAIGTIVLLGYIAWRFGVYPMVVDDLVKFLSGGVCEIASSHTTFLTAVLIIAAVVVLDLLCIIVTAFFQEKILGKANGGHENPLSNLFGEGVESNHFFRFFIIVLFEELLARWFFLGLLTEIPFLSGTLAFYTLFFVGNAIWALIHLYNFSNAEDRKILRVLPQFVGGIFLTYIFVKYGLLAATLAHFASNAVVFAIHKTQPVDTVAGLTVGYDLLCAVVSFVLMDKPLSDILLWFVDKPVFQLEGWGFWDYVKVSVFTSSSTSVVFGVLLYDCDKVRKTDRDTGVGFYLLTILLIIGVLFGAYALLGFFIENVPYRVLVLAILLTFLHKGVSGSAMAREFWTGLPATYIMVCIVQALGLWTAFCWLSLEIVIYLVRDGLQKVGGFTDTTEKLEG